MQLRHIESPARLCLCCSSIPMLAGARLATLISEGALSRIPVAGPRVPSCLLTTWELGELECKQTSKGDLIEEP